MALNGSGTFTRLYSWTADKLAGIKILSSRMDEEFDGIATALSNCLYRDGQATPSANISWGGKRLTNLGDPVADTDAINKQSADILYGGSTGVRLTLTSGVAVTDSDVTSAGTVYATPVNSSTMGIYSGSAWVSRQFTEVAITLDGAGHAANTNYPVFGYWDGSNVKAGTGPAWTSNTSSGIGAGTSEVEVFQGRLVNKYSITLRNAGSTATVPARRALLLGGFRTIGVAGQTEDSVAKRFLSNVYNAVPRPMRRLETVASWNYQSLTPRYANNNSANRLEYFQIVSGRSIGAHVHHAASHSSGGNAGAGIGIDSVSLSDYAVCTVITLGTTVSTLSSSYRGATGAGYHYLSWLEWSGTTATHTFYGDGMALSPLAIPHQTGILGEVVN